MLMTTRAVLMAASIITVAGGGAYAADETPLTLKISAVSGSVMPQDFRAGITEESLQDMGSS